MDTYDIAVIGGGSAGLTIASGAASFGARVVLVEREKLGGDCLNWGCVPTKALIRAATIAHTIRQADSYGIRTTGVEVDFTAVMERMRHVIAQVGEQDSPERFQTMGIDVALGSVAFRSSHEILVGERSLQAKTVAIATGSRATVPLIPGLQETGYVTNVEALQLDILPKSMVILGGGPIGLEFAQVFARLGSAVTVVERTARLLPREDAEASAVLYEALVREGISIVLKTNVVRTEKRGQQKVVVVEQGGQERELYCDELFVATGRSANTEIPGLKEMGVAMTPKGIAVNDHLQTTVPHVYAAGDVKGGLQFTHVAGYDGKVVVRNTLFPLKQRAQYRVIPWTIYTDPEIAHVGLTEEEAREQMGQVQVYRSFFSEVDRAIIDGREDGFVKVIADKKGQIVGAHIVGEHSGELMQELVFAMHHRIPIGKISEVIHAYPTRVEGVRKTADLYWRKRLFEGRMTPLLKRISRLTR